MCADNMATPYLTVNIIRMQTTTLRIRNCVASQIRTSMITTTTTTTSYIHHILHIRTVSLYSIYPKSNAFTFCVCLWCVCLCVCSCVDLFLC